MLAALCAFGAVASADPLPAGLRFELGSGKQHSALFVVRGKERGRLPLDESGASEVGLARYDAKARTVTLEYAEGCGTPEKKTWSVATLNAYVDNGVGYRLLEQGKLAEAIARLSSAVKADPTLEVAITNLASAHMRARDPKAALATLAPLLARKPAATYGKIVFDADLAALTETPELVAIRSKKAGTASIGTEAPLVAVTPELVAIVRTESSWGADCWDDEYLTVLSAKDGALVVELPIGGKREAASGACKDTPGRGARVLMANRFLADLGFEPVSVERAAVSREDDTKRKAYFPVAKLGLVESESPDASVRVLRGNAVLAETTFPAGRLDQAAYLPGSHAFLATWVHSAHEGCESMDSTGVTLIKVP